MVLLYRVLTVFFIGCIINHTTSAQCPTTGFPTYSKTNDTCYALVLNMANWGAADLECQGYGGALMQYRQDTLGSQAISYFFNLSASVNLTSVWIGGRQVYTGWHYVDGSALQQDQQYWSANASDGSYDGIRVCGTLKEPERFHWNNEECSKQANFICETNATSPSCISSDPDIWTFVIVSRCYIVYGGAFFKSWFDADATCKGLGAELSTPKNSQIHLDLASRLDDHYNASKRFWIGLRQSSFYWSTGAAIDKFYWLALSPVSPYDCVKVVHKITEDTSTSQYLWDVDNCTFKSAYICEFSPNTSTRVNISTVSIPPPPTTPLKTTTTTTATPSTTNVSQNTVAKTTTVVSPSTPPHTTTSTAATTRAPVVPPRVNSSSNNDDALVGGLVALAVFLALITVAVGIIFFLCHRQNRKILKNDRQKVLENGIEVGDFQTTQFSSLPEDEDGSESHRQRNSYSRRNNKRAENGEVSSSGDPVTASAIFITSQSTLDAPHKPRQKSHKYAGFADNSIDRGRMSFKSTVKPGVNFGDRSVQNEATAASNQSHENVIKIRSPRNADDVIASSDFNPLHFPSDTDAPSSAPPAKDEVKVHNRDKPSSASREKNGADIKPAQVDDYKRKISRGSLSFSKGDATLKDSKRNAGTMETAQKSYETNDWSRHSHRSSIRRPSFDTRQVPTDDILLPSDTLSPRTYDQLTANKQRDYDHDSKYEFAYNHVDNVHFNRNSHELDASNQGSNGRQDAVHNAEKSANTPDGSNANTTHGVRGSKRKRVVKAKQQSDNETAD